MGVREERRQAAREGILAAAHRQVAEAGLASASMTTVAVRAGVATGSLYRHFPSRGELLAAVIGDALRGEQALLDRALAAAPGPAAGLDAWVRTVLTRARQAPTLTQALLVEPDGAEVEDARIEARGHREAALGALIAAGAADGAWPPGPARRQVAAILGALEATVGLPDATDGGDRGRDEATHLIGFCLAGLRAPRA